jgi:gas vesicle protein
MRSLVSFLLGLIIGAVVILFLPDIRRDNLNSELKSQIQVLQKQIQELGTELKGIKLPTPSSAPSPTPTPAPR